MNPMPGSAAPKNADGFNDGHGDKRDTKAAPAKILNRVPRMSLTCTPVFLMLNAIFSWI